MVLPEKVAGDCDEIPNVGINYKTSVNMMSGPRLRCTKNQRRFP
jgi:hypothetical protein